MMTKFLLKYVRVSRFVLVLVSWLTERKFKHTKQIHDNYPITLHCIQSVEESLSLLVTKDSEFASDGPLDLSFVSPGVVELLLVLPIHGADVIDLVYRHVESLDVRNLPDVATQAVALDVVAGDVRHCQAPRMFFIALL